MLNFVKFIIYILFIILSYVFLLVTDGISDLGLSNTILNLLRINTILFFFIFIVHHFQLKELKEENLYYKIKYEEDEDDDSNDEEE